MNQKQIALLLCSVSAVLMALSTIAIIRSESLRTEVEAKFDAQQKLLDKLSDNQLEMLPLLDPDRGRKPSAADTALDSEPVAETTAGDPHSTLGETPDDAKSDAASKESASLPQAEAEPHDPGPGLLRSQPLTGNSTQNDDTILALASPVTLPSSPTPKMVVIRDDASAVTENAPIKKAPFLENVDEILVQKIVSKWQRPVSAHDGMSVRVNIVMARDGRLKSARVVKTSGNKQFDRSAIDAIMAVQKVPEISQVSDETFKRLYKERTLDF